MKRICLIISGVETALAFEWIAENLSKSKFELHFILLNSTSGGLESYLQSNKLPFIRLNYTSKKDIPSALFHTFRYLKKSRINIVHAHLLDAGIVGMLAAALAGVKKRIYTRHYSTYHHIYHPKGVWYDRLINKLSTDIVAVSDLVKEVLIKKEHVDRSKIKTIHHGFPLSRFKVKNHESLLHLKTKYNLAGYYPVIGVIARHIEWKGIQYIIPAFKKILKEFPDAKIVLANAKGEYHDHIRHLLSDVPSTNVTEIVFENDLITLFQCFDIFVHTPIDNHSEAFGQVYVESMAAGIPSIFTLSGIGNEILKHEENCIVVNHQNSDDIYNGIRKLLTNSNLYEKISTNAQQKVSVDFELEKMISELTNLYE